MSRAQRRALLQEISIETGEEILPVTWDIVRQYERKERRPNTTILGPKYQASWNGRPPGMAKRDLEIWERFRKTYEKKIMGIYYNARTGKGTMPHHQATPLECLMWILNTMLRIDAIVETPNEVWICEVKPDAGCSAIGAVSAHMNYWKKNPPIEKPTTGKIITDNITDQICECLRDLGFKYVKV